MTNTPLRCAIVGAGAMGANHARVLAELLDVELVAVCDADDAKVATLARRHHAAPFTDVRTMLHTARPEAVVVAVPTIHHLDVAMEVIGVGAHVLVEKPIAFTREDGEKLTQAAADAGVMLAVGHIERFNPAVRQLKERVLAGEIGRIFQIDARRQGPFPARIGDVGVIVDLAVHDLDIMRYITDAEVVRMSAETAQRIHSSHEDLVAGILRMSNGVVGTLTINWLTPTKIRKLIVSGERGMFEMNYLTQDLIFFENAQMTQSTGWAAMDLLRGVSEGSMTRYVVPREEPLRNQLVAFVGACRDPERRAEMVSGADGTEALMLAKSLVYAGASGETLTFAR